MIGKRSFWVLVENDSQGHDWLPPGTQWVLRPLQALGSIQEVGAQATGVVEMLQTHGRVVLEPEDVTASVPLEACPSRPAHGRCTVRVGQPETQADSS